MYRTGLSHRLAARHFLANGPPQERIEHPHDYLIEITVSGHELDDRGYLVDIDALRSALSEALGRYQGRCLNELPEFSSAAPSLENLATELHHLLGARLGDRAATIEVRVWEDCEAWASYEGPPG